MTSIFTGEESWGRHRRDFFFFFSSQIVAILLIAGFFKLCRLQLVAVALSQQSVLCPERAKTGQ